MLLSFRIDGLPPSYNRAFHIIWNLRETHLSPEAHHYKNRVKMAIPPIAVEQKPLSIQVEYHYGWYCKNGSMKKQDSQNCDKLLLDAIAERIGVDDRWFKARQCKDYHDDKECFVKVEIDYL